MGSTMGYAAGEYSAGIGGYCSLKNWDKSIGIIIPGRISENSESTSSHARIFLQILQLSFTHTHCFFLEGIFSWYWWFQPLWKIWIRQSQLGLSYIYIYGKNVPSHQAVLRFQHVPTGRNTNGSPVGQPRDDQTCHICRWSPSLHPPRGMANLWFKRWSSVGFLR